MKSQLKAPVLCSVSLLCLAGACGDDGGDGDGDGPSGSALEKRLAACPLVNTSSDPSASACLTGTYGGETLSGDRCTLTVTAGNSFAFDSPALKVSYTPPSDVDLLFSHTSISDSHQVIWMVSDPISNETWYELDLKARFGAYVQESDAKVEIEVVQHLETGNNAVTCIVPL